MYSMFKYSKNKNKIIPLLVIVVVLAFLVYFLSQPKERVVTKKGKPIIGVVYTPSLTPLTEKYNLDNLKTPSLPTYVFSEITKTVIKDSLVYQEIDSLKVLQAYLDRNEYNYTLFDDEYGKLEMKQIIQYNRLEYTDYKYYPNVKYKEIRLNPYAQIGYNTNKNILIGAGLRFNKNMIGYQFNKSLDKTINDSHTIVYSRFFR